MTTDIAEPKLARTTKTIQLPRYKVWMWNDDYTTTDFVVEVLMCIFEKSYGEAEALMWQIHKNGMGLCGEYQYDIAKTKKEEAESLASQEGFPLKVTIEKIIE